MASYPVKGMEDVVTCSICQELFTDARTLSCDHCFCMGCLLDYQTTVVVRPCPLCRKDTVPAARELHRLPSNRAVNDMVGLLVRHQTTNTGNRAENPTLANRQQTSHRPTPTAPSQQSGGTRQASGGPSLAEQLAGRSRPPPRRESPPANRPNPTPAQRPTAFTPLSRATAAAATAASIGRGPTASIGLADLLLHSHIANAAREAAAREAEQKKTEAIAEALAEVFVQAFITDDSGPVHKGITCDECYADNIRGTRYKCGICDNYDLCQKCERKPRHQVHDRTHIFIKLDRPATRSVIGRALDAVALGIGRNMNFNSNVHMGSVTLGILDLQLPIPVVCDRCGEKPIRGTRFKCGMCENYDLCSDCEENKNSFHASSHVFLVLKHPSSQTAGQGKRLTRYNFY